MRKIEQQYGTANWQQWNPYPQPFYDLVVYPPAGVNTLDFFAVVQGNNDPSSGVVKTAEDTNCTVARQLGANFLWILQVRTGVFLKPKARQPNAIATDSSLIFGTIKDMGSKWLELFNRGTLTISIDSKQYAVLDRPFTTCPAGMGLNLAQHASAAAAGPVAQSVPWIQNNPDQANIYDLGQTGLWIAPTQTINVQLQFPEALGPVFTNLVDSASPAIQIGVFLDGYMVRASQ